MKGGALITARLAAEIGRPVLVVPGDVDRSASVGCNLLIRDGAHPVLGVDDLLAELELILGKPPDQAPVLTGIIPPTGLAIDDLPSIWDCTPAEALARLARMEIAGEARRVGDVVLPARVDRTGVSFANSIWSVRIPPMPDWAVRPVDGYLDRMRDQRELSPHTLEAYRRDLAQFFA